MRNFRAKNAIPFWSSLNKEDEMTPNYKATFIFMMIVGAATGLTIVRETMGFKAGKADEEQVYAANEFMHHVAAGLTVLAAVLVNVLAWAMVHKCVNGARIGMKTYGMDDSEKKEVYELEASKKEEGVHLLRVNEGAREIDQPGRCNPLHLVYPPTALKTGLWLTGIEMLIASFALSLIDGGFEGLATTWKVLVESDWAHDVGIGMVTLLTTAVSGGLGYLLHASTHNCFFSSGGDEYETIGGEDSDDEEAGCCSKLPCFGGGDDE